MIATVLGTSLIAMLALVAVAAVNGDSHLTSNDLEHKQAFEAAKGGIDDYAFHLHANGNYWGLCTGVPIPNAVNQQGAVAKGEAKKRFVPGSTSASYAIELIPAEGHAECDPIHPTVSMIETSGPMKGTFRIRSTGFAGKAQVSITATFKTASFLDYVYFTQLETSDPVTYGYANPSSELDGAYAQCNLTREEGRYNKNIPNSSPAKKCNEIVFRGSDAINGPLHSNDTLAICESPTFGRNALDVIETSAQFPGYVHGNNCSASPVFRSGKLSTGVPPLVPPPSNIELVTITEPTFRFTGQVQICLNGASMTVASVAVANKDCSAGVLYSGPLPPNGLVYVSNGICPADYSPFTVAYPTTSQCGNAYVHGTYSGQLTIAATNDIVIDNPLTRTAGGMLGLIANNFVRVFHGYSSEYLDDDEPNCGSGGTETRVENLTIDAAILSINHSFIVDHYDCGSSLGTLTVNGAISQKYRGPVGTSGGSFGRTGYTKNYNYDDRLKYLEPPSFIEPEKLPWVIGRETVS
jgi:hypothetical protein